MARKPRVEFPGALYHVIARGNRRTTLFHDEADYDAYLERLERYRRRDSLRCYAFILMANHLHLLVETGEVPLSRTMQTSYGQKNSKSADEIQEYEAAQLRKTDLKQVLWGMESGWERRKLLIVLVGRAGIEPAARCLRASCSISWGKFPLVKKD
ncbi:MAG: hypothetical protein CO149_04790 [Nitrospirae bacterium CG_4_9_14_3_um_filter_51_5]|nr:MAG: hypothetical protein CO149_04790 [Nitrospirae bacterium CG_4_9_14_3_um_filter_51_5]